MILTAEQAKIVDEKWKYKMISALMESISQAVQEQNHIYLGDRGPNTFQASYGKEQDTCIQYLKTLGYTIGELDEKWRIKVSW